MRWIILFVGLILVQTTTAQKVALVLSGGAAKGIAHIGVIKALEENNIPIDYIVGTSMGGIIGGCYAAGMSPQQIEDMVLSDDFLRWVNGLPEKGYNYHYHDNTVDPNFIRLYLSLDSTFSFQFNSSIANDVSLNFALAEKMAQANAISKGNFDSLFIPLRVMAADVFTQNEVVIKDGILSDALRATQTVPFFYNPIKVEGRYLFDGGIYNNFPVDVSIKEFSPSVVIGSNVSSKIFEEYPYDRDEKLINSSLLYMLLDKSDPSDIPDSGVYIQPNMFGFTSFDFVKAQALIDSGYVQTMRQMEEIKLKVENRRSAKAVEERRNEFNKKSKPFEFDKLSLKIFNSKQVKYINNVFKFDPEKPEPFSLSQVKRNYFQMVTDPYFSNVYPNILFNDSTEQFIFQLTRRSQKNFQVDFGGVIATRNVSNIFLGLNFYNFDRTLMHAQLNFQTGAFYKSILARVRFDLPFNRPMYFQPQFNLNQWDYLEGVDLLQKTSKTVLKRIDRNTSVEIGWPMGNFLKGTLSATGFLNLDQYSNGNQFVSSDTLDELRLGGFKASFKISMNDLNRKQYASAGKAYTLSLNYFNVDEKYSPGNTSFVSDVQRKEHQWFRVKGQAEHFFTNRGIYRVGYFAEGVFSNQPVFSNYTGTIANASAFLPIQDSRTLMLQNFRAFNYVAGGLRNVFVLNSSLDLRLEGYLFKPIEYLREGSNQETVIGGEIERVYLAATGGLVMHSLIGPISLSVNYYDDPENEWGVLLHVGFLLFNKHSIEQ